MHAYACALNTQVQAWQSRGHRSLHRHGVEGHDGAWVRPGELPGAEALGLPVQSPGEHDGRFSSERAQARLRRMICFGLFVEIYTCFLSFFRFDESPCFSLGCGVCVVSSSPLCLCLSLSFSFV